MADKKFSNFAVGGALVSTDTVVGLRDGVNTKFTPIFPLTTKGDLFGFSTLNDRVPVGTNTQVLTADSTQPLGVKWATPTTGTVTSVSGTSNRISSTGGNTPAIDISASYVGQTSITTVGTITTGAWNGSIGATTPSTGVFTTLGAGGGLFSVAANGDTGVRTLTIATLNINNIPYTSTNGLLVESNNFGYNGTNFRLGRTTANATLHTQGSNVLGIDGLIADGNMQNRSANFYLDASNLFQAKWKDETGAVRTTQLLNSRPAVVVSAASKTLALSDAYTFQQMNSGSTQTITIPPAASIAFEQGTEIDFYQQGAGQVVFVAGAGVTIQSAFSNLKIAAQSTGASLRLVGINTWALVGNLTA